ncbi:MAG TPA: hypothetical protein DC010_01030 [Psychrobacter sp.]|nr:hypothetical protein [Psychrobacter sp.]
MGENGILKQLTKRLAERALQAEMTHHLGYAKHDYQVFFSVVDSRGQNPISFFNREQVLRCLF